MISTSASPNGIRPSDPYVVKIQSELDDYYVQIREVSAQPTIDVLQILSAISGRLCEIRSQLVRNENRVYLSLRTKEIDPLLEEVDRQFRIHSRIAAVRQAEWELAKGQV